MAKHLRLGHNGVSVVALLPDERLALAIWTIAMLCSTVPEGASDANNALSLPSNHVGSGFARRSPLFPAS